MNREEIDELFESFLGEENEFIIKFLKYADMDENVNIEELEEEDVQEAYKIIMSKIENGDYEYFCSKKENKDTIELYITLMSNSSKTEDFEKFAQEYLTPEKIEEFGFNEFDVLDLITATGKVEEYLTKEKLEELGLGKADALILIQENIEKALTPEIIKELGLKSFQITELIKEQDEEIVRKYLFDDYSEDLDLSIANVIKGRGEIEKYLTIEKIKEFGLSSDDVVKLIKETGKIEEYLTSEKINECGLSQFQIITLIENTGNIEKYLTPEKITEIGLEADGITNLIIMTGNVDKYLIPEKIKEFGLGAYNITKLIANTGNIEKYLIPEQIKEFGLEKYHITELIEKTGEKEKYLLKGQDKDDKELKFDLKNLIKAISNKEKYLTPEKIQEFGLNMREIMELINDIEDGTQKRKVIDILSKNPLFFARLELDFDIEFLKENLETIYLIRTGKELTNEQKDKILNWCNKNNKILKTINFDFFSKEDINGSFTEEQMLRIVNYPEIQSFIVRYSDNQFMPKAISYIMQNDTNWVISLNTIIKNESKYKELLSNIAKNDENEVTEEAMQQLLSILSDTENYFEVQDIDDVNNFYQKRNDICLKILNGNTDDIPDTLKSFNKDDLCKFALLEYKMGISLDEAKRLIERYGEDSKELPSENTASKYLNLLKDIIECEDIQSIIDKAIAENTLKNHWAGFPNARNAEGDIINLFAELYNEVLYNPKNHDEDKSDIEEYVETVKDEEGNTVEKKHKIDVYTIKKDFNMNIRVEGAYREFNEPENFKDYYDRLDFSNHGNCESFIRNDNIAVARNTDGVMVGYNYIRPNSLAGMGPYDLHSQNTDFSIFSEKNEHPAYKSQYRVPKQMGDNTRHNHNEMIKERVVLDANGNVAKNTPDFVVWIEENLKEQRNEEWKKEKEKNPKWIRTKKLAAQLGIPIVVIDREYFAEREMRKLLIMQSLIIDKEIDEQKYSEYLEEYKGFSKPELIKKVITKFENNATGLRFNEELKESFFTQRQLRGLIRQMRNAIEKMPQEEAKQCMQSLMDVVSKEQSLGSREQFYTDLYDQLQNEWENSIESKEENQELLRLYLSKEIDTQDVNQEKQKLEKDLEDSKFERSETVSEERKE